MTRAPRVPDPAFPCLCLNRQVQIWFPTRGHCRTHGHQTYNRHPIRRYRPTRDRLNFRLTIHL